MRLLPLLLSLSLAAPAAAQGARRCDYHDPKWSPTDDLIAFYSNRDGDFDVYTVRADGTGLRQLTNSPGSDGGPAWSLDGRTLVFVSDSMARGTLHFMGRSGAPVPGRPPLMPRVGPAAAPAWTPDGAGLVFESKVDGNRDLFRAQLADGTIERLTTDSANDFRPAVSPDGRLLAFQSNRGGTYQVYVKSLQGGPPRAITTGTANSAHPAWSPDGRTLAFMSDRSGNMEIYVQGLMDSLAHQVTHSPGDDNAPDWAPDGRRLVFSSSRTGASTLFIIDVDGRHERPLIGGCQ